MTDTRDAVLHSAPGALVLEHVTRRYPGNPDPSVDDLSLTIAPGELLALVGASGSGKTTTLRIAAGYETPDTGRVLLGDGTGAPRDITREPPQRRGFGMVFQHYALFPHMRVEENVAFGLEARGMRKGERLAKARAALDAVGLGGKAERPVQALSGGEQQRVALARALVIQPRVLLLDEPLSNLDPTLRQSMRDELRATLRQSGVTALFVTHDQEDAFAVADRVAMLERGRLLQVGTPESLYHAPATRAVAEFVGRAALVPAERVADRVRISISGVTLEAPARQQGAAGGTALFAVLRPESLVLAEDERTPSWRGEVVGRRFAGGHVVYRVALGAGIEVEVMGDGAGGGGREGARTGVRLADVPVAVVPA
ncbi:MAG TPA: ABC transporter ATP-binding protein [Gemmatimonadaceae bacterium]|nr:ABC transporter ATP-binding protein [Gemmatimonadaceae bacterium]